MARPPRILAFLDSHYDGTETAALDNFFPVRGFEVEYVAISGVAIKQFFSTTITLAKQLQLPKISTMLI